MSITCFGDRTFGFSSVSRTKITLSHEPITLWMFSTVLRLLLCSYHCALNYFLTMSVGFHFNLTFGFKPEVGGIKIVSNCLQKNHFPSWVPHSHFDFFKFWKYVCLTLERVGKGGCRARFSGIKIENSRFTGIETDSRITHNSAFALIFHPCTCAFPPSFLSVTHFSRHLYPSWRVVRSLPSSQISSFLVFPYNCWLHIATAHTNWKPLANTTSFFRTLTNNNAKIYI